LTLVIPGSYNRCTGNLNDTCVSFLTSDNIRNKKALHGQINKNRGGIAAFVWDLPIKGAKFKEMNFMKKVSTRTLAAFVFMLFFLFGNCTAYAAGDGSASSADASDPVFLESSAYDLGQGDAGLYLAGPSSWQATSSKLKSLTISAGTLSPAFNPNKTSYTVKLDEKTSSVTIKASAADKKAKVTPSSKKYNLKHGQKITASIKVKPKSGKTKTYTVTIIRAKSTIASCTLTTSPSKYPIQKYYPEAQSGYFSVMLPSDVSTVTINAKKSNAYAKVSTKVTINGVAKTTNKVVLNNGQMAFVKITSTAQDGINKKVYNVVVYRLKKATDWKLVWSDDFGSLNLSKWNRATQKDGSNGTLQYYRPENVTVSGGSLNLTAKKESYDGKDYTSGLVDTKGKYSFKYGKVEARLKLPAANNFGFFPAVWLWQSVGGNGYYETDIMEFIGKYPNRVYACNHFETGSSVKHTFGLIDPIPNPDQFHTYTLEWTKDMLKWYIDDKLYYYTTQNVPQDNMYIIMNLAVGGVWGGPPNSNTKFPNSLVIDYIKVYQ